MVFVLKLMKSQKSKMAVQENLLGLLSFVTEVQSPVKLQPVFLHESP